MTAYGGALSCCRVCGSTDLHTVLDLGQTPLADRLISAAQLGDKEIIAPLTLVSCQNCSLAQLEQSVAPGLLFGADYPYYSSVSPSLLAHFRDSGEHLIEALGLNADSQVIEAASNDGYLLKVFQAAGIPVLGIDPSTGPAERATEAGIPTMVEFLTEELARSLRDEKGLQADLFLANNVLAHVPEITRFVRSIEILLKPNGVAVIESPYLLDLIDNNEFDTIYHQHVFYYSVHALAALFRTAGLYINTIEALKIHGGSLRLTVSRRAFADSLVEDYLEIERARQITSPVFYASFVERVQKLRTGLVKTLRELRTSGARIAAYGAAAKGNTLLAYCGIDASLLDYVVDLNPEKHNLFMGGNRLRIYPVEKLLDDKPDYLLILAWNFAEEIMCQQSAFAAKGGRFIVPIPEITII